MRLNHNISSLKTINNMHQNYIKSNKVVEKLSSGMRINKAADDTAGLAISEKMRGQIRGLEQAARNIEDGISLVDTAESGLALIHNPNLSRLRDLAVQASNSTLSIEDRQLIQLEAEQIIAGIDDIANGTEFNKVKLLNGANPASPAQGGTIPFRYENVLGVPPVLRNGSFSFKTNEGYPTTDADNNKILVYGEGSTSNPTVYIDGESYLLNRHLKQETIEQNGTYKTVYEVANTDIEITQSISVVKDKYEIMYTVKNNGEDGRSIGIQYHLDTMLGDDDSAPFILNGETVNTQRVFQNNNIPSDFVVYNQGTGLGANAEFQASGIIRGEGIIEEPSRLAIGRYDSVAAWELSLDDSPVGDSGYSLRWDPRLVGTGDSFSVNTFYGQSIPPTIADPRVEEDEGPYDVILQTGANAQNQFYIQLSDVRTSKLGIDQLSLLTRDQAEQSIEVIDQAIKKVTNERTRFGIYHNALEHLENNIMNYKLNLGNAESRIRDTDMAKEIASLTNTNIVLQASQTMLSQSNQLSQSILEFLK